MPGIWIAAAIVFPSVLLFGLVAHWAWNYFLQGPFFHDAGWLSATVYRAGLLPKNPIIASGYREFFSIHFSPILSLGSLISYLLPIGRIPYFCVYIAAIMMPLVVAIPMLVGTRGHNRNLLDALLVALSAIVFTLNGQTIICLIYPHFELLISGGLCLLLAGLASGRSSLAWLGIALTLITREDGGMHSAALLAAALMCDLSGRPWRLTRRQVLFMLSFAVVGSMTAVLTQKLCFPPADLFGGIYTGHPAYSHITYASFLERLHKFHIYTGFVSYPFLATVMIAVAKRDARYALGWMVELPWWLLNLLAVENIKTTFAVYTGFPFISSMFWVAAYARCNQVDLRRRYWLAPTLLIALSSDFGLFMRWPADGYLDVMKSIVIPKSLSSSGVTGFADAILKDPRAYGRLLVDPGVASWTLESISPADFRWRPTDVVSFDGYDGIAFFAREDWLNAPRKFLSHSPFKNCGKIRDTNLWCCLRPDLHLPPHFEVATKP